MRPASCELLTRWYAGDREALTELVHRHRAWLHIHARRKLGAGLRAFQDSDDVVQDVLLKLLEYGPAFAPRDEGQFRALVARMVTNHLADLGDYARAARRNRLLETPLDSRVISRVGPSEPSSASPDRRAAALEEEAMLRLALELIEPHDREVIVLRDWEGLGFADVGRELGVETKAATKRYHRAVVRLGTTVVALRSGELDELLAEVGGSNG